MPDSEHDDLRSLADEAQSIRAAMDTLPSEQCQVIELAYFGGFSQTEIASMLETPLGTVKGSMRGVRLLIVTDEPVSGSRVPTGEQIISVNPA